MRNIFTRLLVVSLLLLTTATLSAQQTSLTAGKVYKFINCSYSTKVLASNGANDTRAADAVDGEESQHWYCETETIDGTLYYKFRNLINGRYLAGNGASSNWPLVAGDVETDTKYFTLETSGNYNVIRSKAHANDGYAYMHSDGSYNIVGWCTDANGNATSWTISEVEYTADDIASILGEINTMENEAAAVSTYQSYLDNIFADKACTTFKQGYVFSENESNYQALPATLKNMVKKVSSDDWTEANGNASKEEWGHKYAKKFRVQMYEPYSFAGYDNGIISFMRFDCHANNDNPTGIYAHERGNIYVMVQGEIKQGATLRLVDAGSNDRITNPAGKGYELKTGLNIVPCYEQGGHFYVCYNVETYTPDTKEFNYKLSDFEPLKIHIEGGAINGFYNAQGDFLAGKTYEGISYNEDLWKTITGASVDCDEDWEYMETRANLSVVPVLGHRQILLFSLNTTNEGDNGMAYYLPENINIPTTPYNRTGKWSDFGLGIPDEGYEGYKVNIMMEAWDRIMYSELATMGLVSKDDMDKMNDLYPRWKADGSQAEMYDFNGASVVDGKTYQDFCEGRDYSEYFNHHGVALGVGGNAYMYGSGDHCGYHHNTMNGIIQNIAYTAGSTWGPAHEIGHQHQDTYLLNGQTEVTNNLFSNIALWYKGISTSRYNGNNGSLESVLNAFNTEGSDTYTNNIWALTHLYYRLWLYYHLAGNNTQFWPRLYELLRVDPLQNGGTISGDRSLLLFYKHACTAAGEDLTEFFRAHGFLSVMDNRLVGDYANAYYTVTQDMIDKAIDEVKAKGYEENLAILFINDDDETAQYVQHDGKTARKIYDETTPNSDFGSVSDFINGNVEVSTAYTASVSADGTVTMSGGEGGVGFLVLNEKGEIVSFSNKSTFAISDEAAYLLATGKATVVAVDTESNTTDAEVDVTAMRFALLEELVENAIALTLNTSETRVGFYKPSAVTNLQDYVTMAQEIIANGDLANLQAVYELLYAEYNAVVANEYSRVTLVPSSKYAITSVKNNDRILTYSGSNVTTVSGNADDYSSTDAYQWYIEREGAYYIKNAGTSKYIQDVTDQNGVLYTVGDNKVNMNINEVALGCYTIATSNVPGRYMNMDGANAARIITWGDAYSENSQWAFILLDADDTNAAKEKLLELSNKTLTLVNEVATISYDEGSKISLQSSDENAPNYIWSNAAVSSNNVDKLIDGNKDTYFHSQWNNSTAPADSWGHHLTVDMGASSKLNSFKFKFTTRNQDGLSNHPKTIEVYGSNDNSTYTKLQVASGFATGKGVDNEAVVKGNGTAYRYLRFLVTDATTNNAGTNTGSDGMVFFHMSEFSIYPAVATVKEDYKSNITSEAVLAAYNDAESGKLIYNNASATLDDINARTTTLGDGTAAGSYTTLLAQYNNVLNSVLEAKKTELLTLITNTNSLIETMGSVVVQGPQKVALAGKLYAHLPYTAGGTNDSDYSSVENNYNLLDGDVQTHFHSDYSANMPDVPYIRVDLGDGNEVKEFTFNYTTRSTGTGYPTTIKVYGANTQISYDDVKDSEPLATFTTSDANNAMPTSKGSWTSEDIVSETPYRYFVFAVTSSSVTSTHNNVTRPYFVMSEFGFTEGGSVDVNLTNTSTKVDEALLLDSYLATTKSQKLHDTATTVALLDAAIADQQAAYDRLNEAMQIATCDKAALQTAYEEALELYNKMADAEGNVTTNYAPSTLTIEQLAAAKTALDAAKDKLDNSTAQDEIDTAKGNLETAFAPLNTVESLNVAATKDKSTLETLINDASTLLGTINGNIENNENYYAGADGLALAELQNAHAAAVDAKDRYYLTEEQYNNVYNTLNSCYTATNAVVIADVAKDELNTLITTMEDLLATTTVSGAQTAGSLPLQVTDKTESFYILTYPRATDDNGKGAIIDETDGVGNTGTFIGTYWQSSSEAYSHYVEIDLGVNTVIEDFSIDYTTRQSGAADSRPTGFKFYGSNDKETYTELFSVTEGLPTSENTKWEMSAPHELAKNYRYIRVAVASNRGGCFNMSDFNLYSHCTATVNQDYSTSNIFDCLPAALREYCDAKEAAGKYLVADDCTAAKEQLEAQIGAIQDVIDSNLNERAGLETLANETNALVTEVATVNEAETAIAMQCTDANEPYYLYCNAAGAGNGDGDALGVAALVGDKATNTEHLHTAYQGNTDDDLDHYLRLDMGENKAITSFKFSYTGRNDGNNNDPKVMLIEGSNDLENFEPIAKLTDLPSSSTPTTYTSDVLGNGKAYRYIRFMVIKTNNNAMYKEHPFFVLSQFAVTAYKTIEVNSEYASKLPMTTLVTANNEVAEAGVVVNQFYVTQDAYDNAYAELAAAKAALEIATAADKTELKELIEATTALKSRLYETAVTNYTSAKVTLQYEKEDEAGYLYCNAPEKEYASWGDADGVKSCIDLTDSGDPDLTTYLHSDWDGDESEDGLDHYLRVDLGADGAANYIEFKYNARTTDLAPSTILVQACNSLATDSWTDITTLKDLSATTDEVASGCLGNGAEYRYWRFMVIATKKGDKSAGHPYFALTNFEMYTCTDVELSEQLKYTPTIYIHTTTELVTEVENAITAATDVDNNVNATQTIVDAEVEALQAVYDKLEEALKYADIPVAITTDEESPVLYKIFIKRTADVTVLKYDEATKQVAVVNTADNSSWQAWYFTGSKNGVRIHPFNADGKVLAADNTSNNPAKVWAAAKGEKNFDEWKFVSRADGYYNIQARDGSNYFSNNGGTTNKMGFWNDKPDTDGGSLFKFVEAEFDNDNARYYQLSDVKATMIDGTNIYGGTSVGLYTGGKEYREAYTAAGDIVTAGNSSASDECYAAYKALREAKENLSYNEPDAEKLYVIKSMSTNTYCKGKYVHTYYTKNVNHNNYNHKKLVYHNYEDITNKALAVFKFEGTGTVGKYKMKNLYTGLYVKTFEKNKDLMGSQSEAQDVYITGLTDGQVTLNISNQAPMHAQEANTLIVHWDAEADNASAWTIEEFTKLEDLTYTTTMSQLGYGTLMLGYDVKVPDGITANAAKEVDGKYIIFEEVGGVIPANTAVILKSKEELTDALTLNFEYAGNNAVALEDNMLGGSLYDSAINGVDNKIYQMQANNGTVKFYWMYAEYNQAGELTNAGTDDGGYVKLPANKAYFSMPNSEGASSYSFRFPWEGTTDIEGIVTEDNDALNGTIFDLQGRKIVEIAEPGFYIINGKKVFVEEIK